MYGTNIDTVCLPCGHALFCQECAERMQRFEINKCSICRTTCSEYKKIVWPQTVDLLRIPQEHTASSIMMIILEDIATKVQSRNESLLHTHQSQQERDEIAAGVRYQMDSLQNCVGNACDQITSIQNQLDEITEKITLHINSSMRNRRESLFIGD